MPIYAGIQFSQVVISHTGLVLFLVKRLSGKHTLHDRCIWGILVFPYFLNEFGSGTGGIPPLAFTHVDPVVLPKPDNINLNTFIPIFANLKRDDYAFFHANQMIMNLFEEG